VTAASSMYQCADTQRIAFGFGSFAPIEAHCSVYGFRSSAFIGFPCPKKMAGIRWGMVTIRLTATASS